MSLAGPGKHRRPRRGSLYGWPDLARYVAQVRRERPVDDYTVPRSHPARIQPYAGRTPR